MAMHIEAGKMVCLDYVLSLADGTRIDSTEGSGLWTYVHGHTRMPPGLMRGLEGLGVGDQTRLELSPEDAFGPIDPAGFQEIRRELIPASVLRVGFTSEVPGPDGSLIPVRIHAIQADTVTVDLNHPLAGQHVIFEVTIRHIQD